VSDDPAPAGSFGLHFDRRTSPLGQRHAVVHRRLPRGSGPHRYAASSARRSAISGSQRSPFASSLSLL
jgi:hypothetical protein